MGGPQQSNGPLINNSNDILRVIPVGLVIRQVYWKNKIKMSASTFQFLNHYKEHLWR